MTHGATRQPSPPEKATGFPVAFFFNTSANA